MMLDQKSTAASLSGGASKPPVIAGLTDLTLSCPPSQLTESIRFYEVLGFRQIPAPPHAPAAREEGVWLVLDLVAAGLISPSYYDMRCSPPSGGNEVFVQLVPSAAVQAKGAVTLSFCVPELELFKAHLETSRLAPSNQGGGVWVHDPMGNRVLFSSLIHPFSTGRVRVAGDNTGVVSEEDSPPETTFQRKKRIAVLTSGGDSPGMNCAVRAVVRAAIAGGCEVYVVHEGFQGLVDGGDQIHAISWGDVREFVSAPGTIIGTARCAEFKTIEGRVKGAQNLIVNGVDALVVIGGDGSLTGADLFRSEWEALVEELVSKGRISRRQAAEHGHLTVVGLVGSIDNDLAGTDFTIGAISSLHRICDCIDDVFSTARSHQRAFVVEVMGRHCGWLALMAAICAGADFVFIPEQPMGREEWKGKMCSAIQAHRGRGRRAIVVIVSEGAVARDLKPIHATDVAAVIQVECGIETRVTNLGHVQRGGVPAAQDRILGALQGIRAVEIILKSTSESKLVAIQNNAIVAVGLMGAVRKTQELARLVAAKQFDEAMQLRDPHFRLMWDIHSHAGSPPVASTTPLRIGILHIGTPAGGMNAATRTLVLLATNAGHTPVAFHNGIRGLLKGESSELSWLQVVDWTPCGGSKLGTNRDLPEMDYGLCAYQLQRHAISGLFVVGGFEAYRAVAQLVNQRPHFPAFCVPIAYVPATISNNVPGADYSLGCDTSLNAITEACDRAIQSAASYHSRAFVVEVQGGHSGFLATLGGLSVGASRVYTPETGITLQDLSQDVAHLKTKFLRDSRREDAANVGRVVLVTDGASKTYSTEVISGIFAEEGKPFFDSHTVVLGHVQQGGTASPMDRLHAVLFAHRAFFWLAEQCEHARQGGPGPAIYTDSYSSAVVVGTASGKVAFTPILDLASNTDWDHRRPRRAWWHTCDGYNRLLSRHDELA